MEIPRKLMTGPPVSFRAVAEKYTGKMLDTMTSAWTEFAQS